MLEAFSLGVLEAFGWVVGLGFLDGLVVGLGGDMAPDMEHEGEKEGDESEKSAGGESG